MGRARRVYQESGRGLGETARRRRVPNIGAIGRQLETRKSPVALGHLNARPPEQLPEVKAIEVTLDCLEQLRLQDGDLLFNEGGDRDKLGRGWVWKSEIEDCIHQNHVFRARLLSHEIIPELISHYANEFGREFFFQRASQTVNLASINKTQLSRLPVPVIPLKEQQVLATLLDAVMQIGR
jgi:type I restriction enzyme S subunit